MRLGLFGLPGAGKGTQAERMAKRWSIPHISTGDMFRDLQRGETDLAKEIREILASGALVPDDLVTELAFERLGQQDCKDGFILDGFPRTINQAKALQAGTFSLDGLISLDVERSEIVKRLSQRRVCEHCKSVFGNDELGGRNTVKCPRDGYSLVQRADDMPDAVATRLDVFQRNFSPVMEFYGALGRLHHINGNGSADMVFERISKLINEIGMGFDRHN